MSAGIVSKSIGIGVIPIDIGAIHIGIRLIPIGNGAKSIGTALIPIDFGAMEAGNGVIFRGYRRCEMANKEQLAILKQGVAAWNKWREENPDVEIDLSGAYLDGIDLSGANFSKADICSTNFKQTLLTGVDFTRATLGKINGFSFGSNFSWSGLTNANFDHSVFRIDEDMLNFTIDNDGIGINFGTEPISIIFSHANLTYTSWKEVEVNGFNFFHLSLETKFLDNCFKDSLLNDHVIREMLTCGSGQGLSLKGKNLKNTRLVNFDLRDVDLRETYLMQANLSGADITGAKLYGSARENWIIDGIRCDYVYWDEAGEQRTPPDRDFRPGEFEELNKQLPTFEYVFANGFTPLDPLIMDRVVQAVNERHKEFSLELVNFDKRGQPHATFTVCHLDYVDAAKGQLTVLYENTIAYLMKENEDKKRIIDRMNDSIDQLIRKTPSLEGVKLGDTYNNYGQVAAMGKKATASGNTFQQITAELSRLHEEMQRSAKTPEQRAAAEDVAKAAQAARENDQPTMQRYLKNAGSFALDCAKTVVTDVTAEYLKKMTLGG